MRKECPSCGKEFACTDSIPCWCTFEEIDPVRRKFLKENFDGCLCRDCIK